MADDRREFGKPEGLARRLAMWANSLGKNKSYPWLGLGIVDDLKCAAKMLGQHEDPNDFYTHQPVKPVAEEAAWDTPAPSMDDKGRALASSFPQPEYDL